MPINIRPYAKADETRVAEFNRRLREGNIGFQFPGSHTPTWLPPGENRHLYQELFLAVEDDSTVRGGYILKHQEFLVAGEVRSIGNYQLPLSEGVIDKKYNMLGLRFLTHALKKQPLVYALGMGGIDRPLPQLLDSMKWHLRPVPFYFRVCRPARFLRNIEALRTSVGRKFLMDLAAVTGTGWLAVKLMQGSGRGKPSESVTAESFDVFGNWSDNLWQKASGEMALCAVRDRETLSILYPPEDSRFHRLVIFDRDEPVGWAVLLNTRMSDHKQFGNMRVGTVVDCLALPGKEAAVVSRAAEYLSGSGVDLIVSNQMHPAYREALKSAGFLNGPSNFILATSPKLTGLLGLTDEDVPPIHMTRGDGDGPIHL